MGYKVEDNRLRKHGVERGYVDKTHLKPFLNLLETSFKYLILPVPVVFLRLAFWPHSYERSLAAG